MGEKPGETVENEEGSVPLENKGRQVCSYMWPRGTKSLCPRGRMVPPRVLRKATDIR